MHFSILGLVAATAVTAYLGLHHLVLAGVRRDQRVHQWIAAYCGVILYVVSGLRRVFATLTAGDPFHPSNINRMRLIGLGLAGLAVGNVMIRKGAALFIPGITPPGGWVDMPTWFSVLVVFVLAEVFREGARLRREAELTI